ncbi:alpha-1,2-fucosyltransferase [Roseibium aggregatum]|uniref:alpha-1,2-fucosyltransferase n=1 Tax=Roseibium aggregatum TaxID=187304 RepID=UPI001A8F9618|nr:alpha-1,2-fucosyltransferase [Roseibium aggregatum]MBN8183049.1 alpha-1,2-fucosyltransferase [Roseibium aggregatum]
MIIVRITGGLGNQMFQYALGRSLSEISGKNLKLDISAYQTYNTHNFLLDKLNTRYEIVAQKEVEQIFGAKKRISIPFISSNKVKIVKEKALSFNPNIMNVKKDAYFIGYWQSEKYFKNVRSKILEEFQPNEKISKKRKEILNEIKSARSPISVHIRRGDYVSNIKANNIHGTCEPEWYKTAANSIKNYFEDVTYFVFSDDPDWVKRNIRFDQKTILVEPDVDGKDYEDLYMMAACDGHIIANSTFSWWGAWLNSKSNKRVIAPSRWFKSQTIKNVDLIPADWICL